MYSKWLTVTGYGLVISATAF